VDLQLGGAGVGEERQRHALQVHGRQDLGCPVRTAWELTRAWPDAELYIVEDSGHTGSAAMRNHLLAALDTFAHQIPRVLLDSAHRVGGYGTSCRSIRHIVSVDTALATLARLPQTLHPPGQCPDCAAGTPLSGR
jgi:hypothetical protein